MINFPLICGLTGWVVAIFSLALIPPVATALFYDDGSARSLILAFLGCLALGGLFIFLGGPDARQEPRYRDGLAVVSVSWLTINVLGATPYWLSGSLGFWDGLYESFSGLSSTGGTVVPDLSFWPQGLLLWRSLTQWIGGMGVIVLMVAILPFLGVGGQIMLKNEASRASGEKLRPRVAQTAKSLWQVYLALSLTLFLALLVGGLEPFEALCQSLTVISTGGFSNYNESVAAHQSYYVKWVIIVFMFMGSLSFAMIYQALSGQVRALLNPEALFFLLIVVAASVLVASPLMVFGFYAPGEAFFHSIFQVVSVASTSGFSTADWGDWPELSQATLLALFFVGGCSGSTSGGLKCVRWLILFKSLYRAFRQYIHPKGVFPVRLGGKPVADQVLEKIWLFFFLYLTCEIIGTLLLLLMGLDLSTAFTAVASSLGNVGPVLGQLGPTSDLSSLPGPAKGVLSFLMLLGRLEFYSVLVLLFPEFWSR
ncbi:MAG: TrkH family potassium uptake protein [Deltaproteobacteria bacterium]|nr:TrkH family potassium uptake protein [Deltaproteobacteria bacterium]